MYSFLIFIFLYILRSFHIEIFSDLKYTQTLILPDTFL